MLKYYETLGKTLEENNFDVMSSITSGKHIMAHHIKTDMWYICHYEEVDGDYGLDSCKAYDVKEKALLMMIKLIAEGNDD